MLPVNRYKIRGLISKPQFNILTFSIFEDKAKSLIARCSDWEEKNPRLGYNCYDERASKRNTRYDVRKSGETIFSDCERGTKPNPQNTHFFENPNLEPLLNLLT